MNRKLTPIVLALGAVVLLASQVDANPLFRVGDVGVALPSVPEIDFRDLGSVGIGTLVVAAGYVAQKAYHKITGRKRN